MKSSQKNSNPSQNLTKISKKSKKSLTKKSQKQDQPTTSSLPLPYMSEFIEKTPENEADFEKIAKLQQNQKRLQIKLGSLLKQRQMQHQMYSLMISNFRNHQEILNDQIDSYSQQYVLYRDLSHQMNHIITMLSLRVRDEMGEEFLMEDPEEFENDEEEE